MKADDMAVRTDDSQADELCPFNGAQCNPSCRLRDCDDSEGGHLCQLERIRSIDSRIDEIIFRLEDLRNEVTNLQ